MKKPTGSVRYKDGILTVTVLRKRGKALKPLLTVYSVEDARPDPRVASPAFTLKKGWLRKTGDETVFDPSGEVYHVSQNEYGIRCDCFEGEIRERRGEGLCKHAISLQKAGLLPT